MKNLFLALLLQLILVGCARHHLQYDIVHQNERKAVYTLKESCYVIMFHRVKSQKPQIAGVLPIPGMTFQGLPKNVSESNVGNKYGDINIIGIIPKGTEFTIEMIKTETSFEIGTTRSPIIRIMGVFHKQWPLLDAEWISDPLNPERIHPAYAQ